MPRILIIEDEAPMRTALVDCLESEGHRALAAADGETGLSMALKEQPDLPRSLCKEFSDYVEALLLALLVGHLLSKTSGGKIAGRE